MMNKFDDLQALTAANIARIQDFITHREEDEDMKETGKFIIKIFAIIGVIVAIAAAAYGIYRFFVHDYLDDFDDDFDDDLDDDYYEDEDDKNE